MEKQMYGPYASLVGNGEGIVEALNSKLIYRACEQAIDLGREGIGGWLLIAHSVSSTPRIA
jgi:hypothetical protein